MFGCTDFLSYLKTQQSPRSVCWVIIKQMFQTGAAVWSDYKCKFVVKVQIVTNLVSVLNVCRRADKIFSFLEALLISVKKFLSKLLGCFLTLTPKADHQLPKSWMSGRIVILFSYSLIEQFQIEIILCHFWRRSSCRAAGLYKSFQIWFCSLKL